MIIVSQDKMEIFNFDRIKKIWIDGNVLNNVLKKTYTEFEICADGEILGFYTTEKRAKEVLQEIISTYQIVMTKNNRYGKELDKIEQFNTVYEMPKE